MFIMLDNHPEEKKKKHERKGGHSSQLVQMVQLALNGVFHQVIFQFEHILKSSKNYLRCLTF